jgi:hypothetical protein
MLRPPTGLPSPSKDAGRAELLDRAVHRVLDFVCPPDDVDAFPESEAEWLARIVTERRAALGASPPR